MALTPVRNGWVDLDGETEWQYQRFAAEHAVRRSASVKGIPNRIRIMPKAAPVALKDKIQQALERNAHLGQSRITIMRPRLSFL